MLKNNILLLTLVIASFFLVPELKAQETRYVISKTTVLRDLPSINGNGVGMPLYGEMVYLLGDRSQETASVRVNGELVEGVWLKVQTQSDQMAWIHSGQLSSNAPKPVYYAWVDQLRIRSEANLQSDIVGKLNELDVVLFLGERSRQRSTIKLRMQNEAHYWLKIQTNDNLEGWVYGGGLKPLKNDSGDNENTNDPNPHNFNGHVVVPVNPANSNPNSNGSASIAPWAKIIVDQEEAVALLNWWNSLNSNWQDYFSEVVLQRKVEELKIQPSNQQLSYIKNIKKLKLDVNDECGSGPFYLAKIEDLNGLSQLMDLEELSCNYMTIRDLRALKNLKNLKVLSLNHSNFESLDGLENLSKLKWLDLSSTESKELDLKPLSRLSNLEELYLEIDQLESFEDFRSAIKLKKLEIRIPDLRSIRGLESLFNLEHLSIQSEQSELDLRALSRLKKLNYCFLKAYGLKYMQSLAILTKLKTLSVSSQSDDFNSNILNSLSILEDLNLRVSNISAINKIGQLRNLRFLTISEQDSFDFNILKNCKQLLSLNIKTDRPLNMKVLANAPKLERLTMESNSIRTILNIPMIPQLTHLTLSSMQLTDLQGLERFPQLYSVDVSACSNLRDLRHIKLINSLQYLYIPRQIPLNSPKVQSVQRPNLDIQYEALGGC